MRFYRVVAATLVLWSISGSRTLAAEQIPCEVVLFCPGDSYFHAQLTADQIEAFRQRDEVQFVYPSPFYKRGYFQATVGFRRLVLEKPPREFVADLSKVYGKVRENIDPIVRISRDENGNEVRDECNGVHVFVIDKRFDLNSSVLGLRYNKNWANPPAAARGEEAMLFGNAPYRLPYQSLLRGETAILLDWRDCDIVPHLKVDVPPNIKWADSNSDIDDAAVHINFQNVRVLALEDEDICSYYPQPTGTFRRIFQIDENGMSTLTWDETAKMWKNQTDEKEK